ncbi:hypothetical protein HY485_01720, partial [Candidatus Woesearchaeota archaeon]|nr:hypothetical protein [Candidatus Woesearchaeota archaeon]
MKKVVLFFIVLLSVSVYAQIDEETITDSGAQCGNGVRDAFEPCDPSSNESGADLCPEIGKIAGIAMVCREEICSCLPRKYIVCGDHHTGGNEMCEADDTDYCADVGNLLNAKLECNSKSCLCRAVEGAIAKPEVPVENVSESLCGNRHVDENEQCDPPGRQCSNENVDGVCGDDCSCQPLPGDEVVVEENVSVLSEPPVAEEQSQEAKTEQVAEEETVDADEESADVVSDATYTVVLIMLVVVFIVGL